MNGATFAIITTQKNHLITELGLESGSNYKQQPEQKSQDERQAAYSRAKIGS